MESAASLMKPWIGLHGYLYKSTKIEDYFVAAPISSIIIPKVFMDLDSFKETLTGLFFFKSFFTTMVPKLRKRILEIEAGKAMGDVYTSKNNSSDQPFVWRNTLIQHRKINKNR
ncbi:hypothetical protein BDF21DRAFT_154672 [Thamnidium elegans]|nr:hypothetical protein BDF21DRAFT_154672 [Thamnidium elegans]